MLERIVCGMLYLLWDRKNILSADKSVLSGVDFLYLRSFFNDIFNHALVIDHSQGMLEHCII